MAEPIFPGVEQILDVLMAELPSGVYAEDRADDAQPEKRSFSSSELRAHAAILAALYSNLQSIYEAKYISTVPEDSLNSWERELFSAIQDSTQGYQGRQSALLAKLRSSGGISLPAIRNVVAGILDPLGLPFAILPWSGQSNGGETGAWILGVSELDGGTYLSFRDPLWGAQRGAGLVPLGCSRDAAAAGITTQDANDIAKTAYTYEVQIYGSADAQTLALLERQLTALEPARSTHVIVNNASPSVDPSSGWSTGFLNWWT